MAPAASGSSHHFFVVFDSGTAAHSQAWFTQEFNFDEVTQKRKAGFKRRFAHMETLQVCVLVYEASEIAAGV